MKKKFIDRLIKKIILFVLLFNLGNLFAQDDNYSRLIKEARQLYQNKQYALSVQKFDSAFSIQQENIVDLYNGSCSYSLNGDTLKALKLLEKAIHLGYSNTANLKNDADLFALHDLKEWPYLVLFSENNKDNVDKFYKQLTKYIDKRDTVSIKKLLAKDFDSIKINKTFKNIRTMYQIFDENNIKYLYKLELVNKGKPWFHKQGFDERKFHYKIYPTFYNDSVRMMTHKEIEFDLYIEIKQSDYKWHFYNLEIDSNYINPRFNLTKSLADFLQSDSLTINFEIVTESRVLTGHNLWDKTTLNLSEILKDAERLDFKAGKYIKNYSTYYTIRIDSYSEHSKKVKFYGTVFHNNDSSQIFFLELFFTDSDSDILAISTGKEFAFYRFTKNKTLRKYIRKVIRNTKW